MSLLLLSPLLLFLLLHLSPQHCLLSGLPLPFVVFLEEFGAGGMLVSLAEPSLPPGVVLLETPPVLLKVSRNDNPLAVGAVTLVILDKLVAVLISAHYFRGIFHLECLK